MIQHHHIPDRLIVLTFDDSNKSDLTVVAPILERHDFGGTFYVTRGLGAGANPEYFLSWNEIWQLDQRGFEIGNHTRSHPNVTELSKDALRFELQFIQNECEAHGIRSPVSFCYPGFCHSLSAMKVIQEENFQFARRGVFPEYRDNGSGGRGPTYDPGSDHHLLIPTTGYAGPEWNMRDLEWAVSQAHSGKLAVLTFHGVPGPLHPWVHTEPRDFENYMQYLHDRECSVIAVRDLARYIQHRPVHRT